jgi:hypothetical protein
MIWKVCAAINNNTANRPISTSTVGDETIRLKAIHQLVERATSVRLGRFATGSEAPRLRQTWWNCPRHVKLQRRAIDMAYCAQAAATLSSPASLAPDFNPYWTVRPHIRDDRFGVTGCKAQSEYMWSALPQVEDIATRSAFHRITRLNR